MKLIALILGLIIERTATHLLHLRELRWFDGYFDTGTQQVEKLGATWRLPGVILLLAIPAIPVALVSLGFRDVLWDLPYLAFAIFVLLFSLGPRDLSQEVEDFCKAITANDEDEAGRVATELLEVTAENPGVKPIVEAIFVQANNRMFGVIFWFVVLGPLGAWVFRLTDLYRRRAAFEEQRYGPSLPWINGVHGVLNFVPARLAAVGYALGGSFDDAVDCWREYEPDPNEPIHSGNDRVIACVGCGAMGQAGEVPEDPAQAARGAMRLVNRTLFIWMTVLALMTIFGWAL